MSWLKAARKDFERFPQAAQDTLLNALTTIAEGGHPLIAKPLQGLGSGILELALKHRGDAFRLVYAVQIGTDIWVVHTFQKKSTSGVATPKAEINLIVDRLKRLKGGIAMSDDFDLVRGSGNVFRDFGRPDPDLRQAKCILAAEIMKSLDERQWSTRKAQQETGVNHADYARIRSVKLDRFTIERLTSILGTLGREVEFSVNVRPRADAAAPSLPGLA